MPDKMIFFLLSLFLFLLFLKINENFCSYFSFKLFFSVFSQADIK